MLIIEGSIRYLEREHQGNLLYTVTKDVETASSVFSNKIGDVLKALISGVGGAIFILTLNWQTGFFVFIVGIISVYINNLFSLKLRKINREIQDSNSNLTKSVIDILINYKIIKMFNMEKFVLNKFKNTNKSILSKAVVKIKKELHLGGINSFFALVKGTGVWMFASYFVMKGEMTVGSVMAILEMAFQIFFMFECYSTFIIELQNSLAAADRIFEILDRDEEKNSNMLKKESININELKSKCMYAIQLKNIDFSYGNSNAILKDFSLDVETGSVVVILGKSGVGKSTIFNLLLDFYKPQKGQILICGIPISNYTVEDLRKKFAYVPQDSYLYNETILNNIRFGNLESSYENVISVSKLTTADEFIGALPNGYDTYIFDNGSQLSGGQKQKISVTRALLKDSPIILLDEPTANLDLQSEVSVYNTIKHLSKNKTVLIITHNISNIKFADQVYVMINGKIEKVKKEDCIFEGKKKYYENCSDNILNKYEKRDEIELYI